MPRFFSAAFLVAIWGVMIQPAVAAAAEDRAYRQAVRVFQDKAYAAAEKDFADFLRRFPESKLAPEAALYQAQALYRTSAFRTAETVLNERLARAGSMTDQYLYWIGECRHAAGDPSGAAQAFEQLQREHPASSRVVDAALGEAFARYGLGQRDRIEGILGNPEGHFWQAAQRAETSSDPRLSRGKILLAEVLAERREFSRALVVLDTLPKTGLDAALTWQQGFLEGQALVGLRRIEEALRGLTNLSATGSANTLGPAGLARIALLHAEALEVGRGVNEALQVLEPNLGTNVPPALRRETIDRIVALLLKDNRTGDAATRIEQFVGESGSGPGASPGTNSLWSLRLILGKLRLQQYYAAPENERLAATNRLSQARSQFALVLTETNAPTRGPAALGLGWCLWEEQALAPGGTRLPEAAIAFGSAASWLPPSEDQATALFKLADCLFAQAQFGPALSNYQHVAEGYAAPPGIARELIEQALYQAVRAAIELGDRDAATKCAGRILEEFPDSRFGDRGMFLVARGLDRLDRSGASQPLLEQFEKRFPDSPLLGEVQLALARQSIHLSDWASAMLRLDRWVDVYREHPARPEAEFERARTQALSGNLGQALILFTNLVTQFPVHPVTPLALNWVADFYFDQGQYDLAEDRYQRLYKNTNWLSSPIALRAQLMAGRCAYARRNAKDARGYFTELINTLNLLPTNSHPAIHAEAYVLLGDSIQTQYINDPANPPDLLREAVTAFRSVTQEYPSNHFAVVAWGRLGDCYMLGAARDASQLENAAVAYTNVINSTLASEDKRNLAGIALAKVFERKAEVAPSTERGTLREEALRLYLHVLAGKYLREDEALDVFLVKEAGLGAARLAEDLGQFQVASGLYRRLGQAIPSQRLSWEEKIKQLESKPQGANP